MKHFHYIYCVIFFLLVLLSKDSASQIKNNNFFTSKLTSLYIQTTGGFSINNGLAYGFNCRFLMENNYYYFAYFNYAEKVFKLPDDYTESDFLNFSRSPYNYYRNCGVGIGKIKKMADRLFLSYGVGIEATNFYKAKMYRLLQDNALFTTENYHPVYTRYTAPGLFLNSQFSWQAKNRFFNMLLDGGLLINSHGLLPTMGVGFQFNIVNLINRKNIFNR